MTDGLLSLGDAIDLWSTAFSGFVFPSHKQIVPLLGDGTALTGNSVLQESVRGFREATVKFTAPDGTQMRLVRGYEETSETVTFVDADGLEQDVRVLDVSCVLLFGDVWEVTAAIQQLTEPVAPEEPGP